MKHPDILDPMSGAIHYFFDKDEPFKQIFEDRWKLETSKIDAAKGDWTVWKLIKEVAAVDMKKVPGVQAADILAWSVNRDNTSGEGSPGKHLRHIMQQVIPSGFIIGDEAKLREHFKPLIFRPGKKDVSASVRHPSSRPSPLPTAPFAPSLFWLSRRRTFVRASWPLFCRLMLL